MDTPRKKSKNPAHTAVKMQFMHGFRSVNQTGVICSNIQSTPGQKNAPLTFLSDADVMNRARENGFFFGNKDWANLGQGAPELGDIPGSPERPKQVPIEGLVNEYSPVAGWKPLREAVANLYNQRFRQGKKSVYTWKNVCITPGGRAALTRLAASIGNVNVGFFLPEYTAYEEILSVPVGRFQMFKRFVPIPHSLDAKNHYSISVEELRKEIQSRGLGVILKSNPSNPVGTVVQGDELHQWVKLAQETHCSMIFDEFYSSYIYNESEPGKAVSAAEFVDDVNQDPVVIVDGLTKNWRLPGWRVTWVVGPEEIISAVASCGSFLDGGANGPLQRAAIPLLQPEFALQDSIALQHHFKSKRDYMVERLTKLGFLIRHPPQGTFYVWASVKNMPASINNAWIFFEEALKEKVICVPGIFFDVNPGRRRQLFSSPYHYYIRFSFGPPMEELTRGLDQLERLIQKHHELNEKSGQGSM